MTEIPEHLLKRSKERRAAMGLPGGEADDSAPASAPSADAPAAAVTPAAARAATPVPAAAAPPPPKPDPAYVQAAKSRRRIPFWAMPIVALLPIWSLLYLNAVKVPPSHDDALANGAVLYAACSACHGASGGGNPGAELDKGEVIKTFKSPKDMMMWIYLGKEGGTRPDGTYGDADRPGGARNVKDYSSVMPAHHDMDAADLAAVTRYVRETLSGEATPSADVIANYATVAQAAIDDAKAGKLPSASTVKGG